MPERDSSSRKTPAKSKKRGLFHAYRRRLWGLVGRSSEKVLAKESYWLQPKASVQVAFGEVVLALLIFVESRQQNRENVPDVAAAARPLLEARRKVKLGTAITKYQRRVYKT